MSPWAALMDLVSQVYTHKLTLPLILGQPIGTLCINGHDRDHTALSKHLGYRCNIHKALSANRQCHDVVFVGQAAVTCIFIQSLVTCTLSRTHAFPWDQACTTLHAPEALRFIQSNALKNPHSTLWCASCRKIHAKLGQKCRVLWRSSKPSTQRTWHSCRSSLMASRRPWTSRRLLRRRWNRSGQGRFLYCSCHIAARKAVLSCLSHHDMAHL